MKRYFVLSLAFLCCLGNLRAQTEDLQLKVPNLDGHTFPTFSNIRTSFVNTSLRTNIAIGSTGPLQIGGIKVGDNEIFTFEGSLLFYTMVVEYQQRFTPWLSLFASYSLSGRLGTSMSAILVDGVNTLNGGEVGWLVRLKQNQKWNVSAFLSVKNYNGRFISVKDYFEELIAGDPYPSAIKSVPALVVNTGVNAAHAFSPTFGIQLTGEVSYGETFVRGASNVYFTGGVAADLDFLPRHKVPLGLGMGYLVTAAPEIVLEGGNTYANMFSGRLAYTGSPDYELAFQYSYHNVKLLSFEEAIFISKAALVLKFYF